jgi:hypothetical protein
LSSVGLAQSITVTLRTPNGGDSWEAGSAKNITWETSGTPDSVNLYYSLNNGASFTTIATNTLDAHSYTWTVPTTETSQALISIEAVKGAETVTAESAAPFSILDTTAPLVTVSLPAGGEKWVGGSTHNISFEATDLSGLKANSLSIWYSVNNGGFYGSLVTSDAAVVSPYSWTVPALATTEVRVEVLVKDNSVRANAGLNYNSAKFMIDSTAPTVSLTQPNGGASLPGGVAYAIKWTATDECVLATTPITLRYSTNSGSSWTFITNEANSGSYNWSVPYIYTTEARVSVEATNQVGLVGTAMSSGDFTILADFQGPVITVDAPAGGEKWVGGTAHNINFRFSDPSGIKASSLSAWYSTDNGLTYSNLITSGATVSSPYSWTLPSNVSTTEVKVRLQITDNSLNQNIGTGESAQKFTIDSTAPAVTVIQPNGGETITGNSATYEVKWVVTEECGLAANPITIRYSKNSGATWILITNEANTGSYIWTLPNIDTIEARVSVEAVNLVGLVGTDKSNNDFTILSDFQGPNITVDAPSGSGYVWKGGTTHYITFEATDPSGIKQNSLSAWYSTDGGQTYSNLITSGASTVSPYTSWTLPTNVSTTDVKVRLQLTDNSLNQNVGTGESAKFTIDSTAPAVTVIQPNGGDLLSGNNSISSEVIMWTATDECGLANNPITIRYSTNSGATWTQIAANEINDGSYTWTVPHINTTTARVSVEATNLVGLVGTDMSDNDFLISSDATGPSVTVEAPSSGYVWKGGVLQYITFEASDPSGLKPSSYSIYYSLDNGSNYTPLVTDWTGPSPYHWNPVPSFNSNRVKIRVTARDIYDNLGTGESTGTFTIDSTPPSVTIISPNALGITWEGGTSHNITWEATDNFGLKTNPITLQYSTNEGVSWINITANVSNAAYSWSVPSLNTNEARVRVIATDEAGNNNSAFSANNFIIDITAPSTPSPLTQLTGSATNDSTPYFSWSAATDNLSGISSYEITIDTTVTTQGAITNFTQPTVLPEGFHTWEVRAKDGAGIWGSPCTQQSFVIITTHPVITDITLKDRTSGSSLYTREQTVTLEASGVSSSAITMMSSENSDFTGAAWQAYQSSTTFQLLLLQGNHRVFYKVRDAAMNESTTVESSIILDTIIPSVSVIDPNGGENLGGGLNYTVRWNAYDNIGGTGLTAAPITIRFSHDGGVTWDVLASHEANSGTYAWIVPNGIDSTSCLISIEAVDLAGNIWSDKSDGYFNLISVGPGTPALSSPAGGSYLNTARPPLQWTAMSNATSYECVIDGTDEVTVATNSYQPDYDLTEGGHTWEVRAKNSASLWGGYSATGNFTVDITGPTLLLDTFTDNKNPQPAFHGQALDNLKVVSAEARLDGGVWQPVTAADGAFDSTSEAIVFNAPAILATGVHSLEARAYDAAGNLSVPSAKLNFVTTKSTVAYDVKLGSAAVTAGTVIPFRPTFTVSFTSPLPIVDFKVFIDTQSVYAHTGSFTSETVAISPFSDLSVGSHSLKITTQNIAGDVFTKEVTGLLVISDVRMVMSAGAATISLAVNTSSGGPATLIIRKPNGQTVLQKTIPDLGAAAQITIDKYIAGENLKGPYLWRIIYNGGRSSKSGGFIVP